ncbi:hypothetical protein AALA56_01710 [Streptococcus hyointestinalis]
MTNSDGSQSYYDADSGELYVSRFFQVGDSWYYADSTGHVVTGSQTINGQRLYFATDGKQIKGDFVTNSDGSQSYYDADSGELYVSRFFQVGDSWYYADSTGHVVTGSQTINGQRLYFATDGKQVKGAFVTNSDGSQSYYDTDSGELYVSRFFQVGNTWYYANRAGRVVKLNASTRAELSLKKKIL